MVPLSTANVLNESTRAAQPHLETVGSECLFLLRFGLNNTKKAIYQYRVSRLKYLVTCKFQLIE